MTRSHLSAPFYRSPFTALALAAITSTSACAGGDGTDAEPREDVIGDDATGGATGGGDMLGTGGSVDPMGNTGGATGGGEPGSGGQSTSGGDSGTGGDESTGGTDPGPDSGPVSCSPVFEEACTPTIEFENQDPNGKGKIFDTLIPDVVATMQDTACTVCSILYRDPDEIPQNKRHDKIRLVLDFHGGVAQAGGGQIQFDLNYIDGYAGGRNDEQVKTELLGVLMHETVHLYQHYGNGGTGEGMADYVRIRTGLYLPGRRGTGGSWRDAYTTSGFFYSWLAGPCEYHMDGRSEHNKDLGYLLNKALGEGGDAYDQVDSVLWEEFGKSADDLWGEYQQAID